MHAPSADSPGPSAEQRRLPNGTLVKQRLPKQRACNEKNDKGKICAGHLKRWYLYGPDVALEFGRDAELYRCERCRTIYLPNPGETPRTGTLAWEFQAPAQIRGCKSAQSVVKFCFRVVARSSARASLALPRCNGHRRVVERPHRIRVGRFTRPPPMRSALGYTWGIHSTPNAIAITVPAIC